MKFQQFLGLFIGFGLLSTSAAVAQPFENNSFTYQGQLNDQDTPVNGVADFQFRLWDAEPDL
jgi:hypothetical protein